MARMKSDVTGMPLSYTQWLRPLGWRKHSPQACRQCSLLHSLVLLRGGGFFSCLCFFTTRNKIGVIVIIQIPQFFVFLFLKLTTNISVLVHPLIRNEFYRLRYGTIFTGPLCCISPNHISSERPIQ